MISLEEILACQPGNVGNWRALRNVYIESGVVPFVGAGMSAPTYPQWGDALKMILEGDKDENGYLDKLLNDNQFDKAASYVKKKVKSAFVGRVQRVFGAPEDNSKERKEATAYLVAEVFPHGTVYTTNFENVLERAYEEKGHKFDTNMVYPLSNYRENADIVSDAVRKKTHSLMKIHGDVLMPSSLVFTKKQYDNVYKYKKFRESIEYICENSTFLFLGCSLQGNDRYLETLKKVVRKLTKKNKNVQNFTIIGLPKKNKGETRKQYEERIRIRTRELEANWGIYPIWYPCDQYEAVRVLLSRLKELSDSGNGGISGEQNISEIKDYLHNRLMAMRKNHPSFALMDRLQVDWIAKGALLNSDAITQTNNSTKSVSDIVIGTWERDQRSHVLLEGEGGIGKTVSMFYLATEDSVIKKRCLTIYCPVYRLDSNSGYNISQYLKDIVFEKKEALYDSFDTITRRGWSHGPSVLLLLDGFNEVSLIVKKNIIIALKDWLDDHIGVQVVATSRNNLKNDMAWIGDIHDVRIQKLSIAVTESFLNMYGLDYPKKRKAQFLETIRRPLMLVLYAKSHEIKKTVTEHVKLYSIGLNPGRLIWNYVQMEFHLFAYKKGYDTLTTAIACEYIAPSIAYYMNHNSVFVLKEDVFEREIKKAYKEYCLSYSLDQLPRHLTKIVRDYEAEVSLKDLRKLLVNSMCIFISHEKEDGSREYQMMHQDFRDGLAAIHLINQCMTDERPTSCWNDALDNEVISLLSDLITKEEFRLLWEQNRNQIPLQRIRLTNLLYILDNCDPLYQKMNFSGLNLSEYSLLNHKKSDMRLRLPDNPECYQDTVFSMKTVRGEGHTGGVMCLALSPSGEYGVSGADNGEVILFNARNGEVMRVFDRYKASYVYSVALTSDEKRCISASYNGILQIWDTESGQEERSLYGHKGEVYDVVLCPDEKKCISASEDKTVRIWNIENGKEEHVLTGHTAAVNDVAVSPNGKYCVSASADKTVRIWNVESGKEEHVLAGHTATVTSVVVSPNGKYCVSASEDKTVRIWNVESGKEEHVLAGHTATVTSVAVSPNGKYCVSASEDKTVRIWNVESGKEEHVLAEHTAAVCSVIISPDSNRCVSASDDKTLRIWNVESGEGENVLYGHKDMLTMAVISPDGKHCISASEDKTVRIWRMDSGEQEHMINGYEEAMCAIEISPDGNHCVSDSYDKTIRMWSLLTGDEEMVFSGHEEWINAILFTKNGEHLISASDDNTIRIWDPKTGIEKHMLTGHTAGVTSIVTTPDGRLCISASRDGSVRIWDVKSGRLMHTLRGHENWVNSVAVTADGKKCVSGSFDKTVRIWDVNSGDELQVLRSHEDTVSKVRITPNGKYCISASRDGTVKTWNVESGTCLYTICEYKDADNAFEISMDGEHVIFADDYDVVKVYHIASGRPVCSFAGHEEDVYSVAISADGKHCVSGSLDGTLHIWDIENCKLEHKLMGHDGWINAIAISSDGKLCVSTSEDKTIRIWDMCSGEQKHRIDLIGGVVLKGLPLQRAKFDSDETKESFRHFGAIVD